MSQQIVQRPRFLFDLAEELQWLNQKAGPEVAERWYEALWVTIEQIRKHPGLGRLRRDLKPEGVRTWRIKGFGRWLIFYSERSDALVFLRVRQGTMDLARLNLK